MAPTRSSTRRKEQSTSGSKAIEERTPKTRGSAGRNGNATDEASASRTPQRKRKRGDRAVDDQTQDEPKIGTPSKKGKPTPASQRSSNKVAAANGTVSSGRKAQSPTAAADDTSNAIGLENAVRSSGRERKKTAKVEEMEQAQMAKTSPKVSTPTKAGRQRVAKSTDNAVEIEKDRDKTPSSIIKSKAKAKVEKPMTSLVEDVSTPVQSPTRKRGRPKASAKVTQSASAAADIPFEDVPIDITSSKRKKQSAPEAVPAIDEASLVAIASAASQTATQENLLSQPVSVPDSHEQAAPTADDEKCKSTASELQALLQKPSMAPLFDTLKSEILLRCSGRKRTPLVGLQKEYNQIQTMIHQTVVAGEGNSMLVIGSRGTGKTTLVEEAISAVSEEHSSDFHIIRLNGFIHTDDKIALREIWRQLGRETQPDSIAEARSNYADTLASLLAVLSHPAELNGDIATPQTAKSVVFVLDEFDLFTNHPRQTLLYNLFDIAQTRKAPVAVLGLTTRLDAAEMLEKRVRSRFSHRYVHLAPARTYSAFVGTISAALGCIASESSGSSSSMNQSTPSDLSTLNPSKDPKTKTLLTAWTTHITTCLSTSPLSTHLRQIYAHSKSIPQVLRSLLPAISAVTPSNPPLPSRLSTYFSLFAPPDNKLTLLSALSDAELCILVAAARLDALHATDSVANFTLAFDEYARLARKAVLTGTSGGQYSSPSSLGVSSGFGAASGLGTAGGLGAVAGGFATATSGLGAGARVWGRDVCLAAWEGLAEKGLLVPVVGEGGGRAGGGPTGAADSGKAGRLWRVDAALEEIGRGIDGWRGGVAREVVKWCKTL